MIVLLLAGEAAARVDDWIRFGNDPRFTSSMQGLVLRDSLTVRGAPNGNYRHFRLNAYGFRGPEITREPRAGCPRVLMLGASETFGFTESPGHEYVAQLRDSLSRHGCFEVLNGAIMGVSTPNMVQFFEEWGRRFHPRIVVYYPTPKFYLEEPPPARLKPAHPAVVSRGDWWKSRLLARLREKFSLPAGIQDWRVRRSLAREAAQHPAGWVFTSVPHERLQMFASDIDSFVTTVRAAGAIPVLLTHATRYGDTLTASDERFLRSWRLLTPRASEATILAFDDSANAILRGLASSGVAVVDADRALTGHQPYFVDSAHFTNLGASVMAGLLAPEIQRLASAP